MKKYFIYIAFAVILLIQIFDKEDKFLIVQYILAAIIIIISIMIYYNRKIKDKTK